VRRVSISALASALVFAILATWLGPMMIGWYATPADQPAMLSCKAAVVGAMGRLVWTQLIGTLAGAIIGVVIGILLGRRKPAGPSAAQPSPKG
jgi:hypothetical protein